MHTTWSLQGVDVTGAVSGARYVGGEQTLTTFQVFPNMVFEQDIITKLIRVGEAPLLTITLPDDMIMKKHVHATFNANGVPTASFSHPVFQCN